MKKLSWTICGTLVAVMGLASSFKLCAQEATEQSKTITVNVTGEPSAGQSDAQVKVRAEMITSDDGKDDKDGKSKSIGKELRIQLRKQPMVLSRVTLKQDDKSQEKKAKQDADQKSSDEKELTVKVVAGQPPKIWLGIGLKEVSGDLATYLGSEEGVFIESVFPDSPAERAKLKTGDVITELNGQKIKDPMHLVNDLRELGKSIDQEKKDAYPAIALTVLRRGESMKVDVVTAERPESMALTVEGQEIEMAEEPASVLSFGSPMWRMHVPGKAHTVNNLVVVVKNEDDEQTVVNINRNGDEPPKISITEGNQERQVTEAEIDQLPAKVRDAVRNALKTLESAQKSVHGSEQTAEKLAEEAKENIHDQLQRAFRHLHAPQNGGKFEFKFSPEDMKHFGGGNVIIIKPEEIEKYGKMAEEMAKEMSKSFPGAKEVRGFALMPEQVKELQGEVEKLKKQVAELQAKLKEVQK